MKQTYVIGIDYGTDSVRALLVDAVSGAQIASSVCAYPRWAEGLYCNADQSQFRQHPLDYLEGLKQVLSAVLRAHPNAAKSLRAIAIDTTASTPCFVDKRCRPLALHAQYCEDPDAMFVLWKDHTAHREAAEITARCAQSPVNYACQSGNHYSAECGWAKALHLLRNNPSLRQDAYALIELCDWIPAVLTGCTDLQKLRTGRCGAALKLMWSEQWSGYPPTSFFETLDPTLALIVERMNPAAYGCDVAAGNLSAEWANLLGVSSEVAVCVGNVDSYSGAVGAGIEQGTLVLNLGTSACYMALMTPADMHGQIIDGIFGQVENSILPGMIGFEAGLSAFGDVYAWFKRLLSWPIDALLMTSMQVDDTTKRQLATELKDKMMESLTLAAAQLPLRTDAPLATDYFNGRRSPAPCNVLTASLDGLTLNTSAPEIYYALAEATAFATKAIFDHLVRHGVSIDKLIGIGGISQKSPFVMQLLADVMEMPLHVSDCSHSCALGAVIHAARVAGVYPSVVDAQHALCPPVARVYKPDPSKASLFRTRYERYLQTGAFAEQLMQP
ncbi:MAG: ribulokinase [Alistipes sp.]